MINLKKNEAKVTLLSYPPYNQSLPHHRYRLFLIIPLLWLILTMARAGHDTKK